MRLRDIVEAAPTAAHAEGELGADYDEPSHGWQTNARSSVFRDMTLFAKRSARALWQAGDRARDARNWPEARAAYAEAIKLYPARYGLWIQYGHAAKEVGDVGEAA